MVRCLTVLSQMIPQLSEWPCLHTSVFASAAGRASSDHVPWPLLAGRTMWPVSHPGSQAEGVLYRSECERVPPLPWALSVLSVRADTGATVSPVWLRLCWAASRNVFMPWHLSSSRGLPEVGTRAAGAPPPLGPGLIASIHIFCSLPTKILPLILSTDGCPEISRHRPQATQQTLAQPYSNCKFGLHHAGPSFSHPQPSMNLPTCSLRLHIAWATPCLEPQCSRIRYLHRTEMNPWGRM